MRFGKASDNCDLLASTSSREPSLANKKAVDVRLTFRRNRHQASRHRIREPGYFQFRSAFDPPLVPGDTRQRSDVLEGMAWSPFDRRKDLGKFVLFVILGSGCQQR